jgi:hypothetical protein
MKLMKPRAAQQAHEAGMRGGNSSPVCMEVSRMAERFIQLVSWRTQLNAQSR